MNCFPIKRTQNTNEAKTGRTPKLLNKYWKANSPLKIIRTYPNMYRRFNIVSGIRIIPKRILIILNKTLKKENLVTINKTANIISKPIIAK